MTHVPILISWNGRSQVVWECNKYSVGSAALDAVLKELHIQETDYFSLSYKTKDGRKRWLNLRNPTLRELKIAGACTPFNLELHVKFFVPPKQIFQSETRLAFYHDIHQKIMSKEFIIPPSFSARIFSLMAQIDLGDATEDMSETYKKYYSEIWMDNWLDTIYIRHLDLAKSSQNKLVTDFLREVSTFASYGVESHSVIGRNGKPLIVQLGIKELGIYMQADHTKGTKIPLKDLNGAKVKGKSIFFSTNKYKASLAPVSPTIQNSRVIADLELEFADERDARIIYRSLLERHMFYCRQSAADLTDAPHFNSRWQLLKSKIHPNKADKYRLFSYDVQRTSKEAYQHFRKLFTHSSQEGLDSPLPQSPLINSTIASTIQPQSPLTLAQRRPMTAEDLETHVYFGKPNHHHVRAGSLKSDPNKYKRSTSIGIPQTPKTAFESHSTSYSSSTSGGSKFTFSPPSTEVTVFSPLPPTPTPLSPTASFDFPIYSLQLKDSQHIVESAGSSTDASSPEDEISIDIAETLPLLSSIERSLLLEPVPISKMKPRKSSSDEVGVIPSSSETSVGHKQNPTNEEHSFDSSDLQKPPELPPRNIAPTRRISLPNHDFTDLVQKEDNMAAFNPSLASKLFAESKHEQTDWECKLCMDAAVSTVFIPCGHMASCRGCAHKVRTCPLCDMEILLTQTVCLPRGKGVGFDEKQTLSSNSSLSNSLSPSVSSDLKFDDSSNENIFNAWSSMITN